MQGQTKSNNVKSLALKPEYQDNTQVTPNNMIANEYRGNPFVRDYSLIDPALFSDRLQSIDAAWRGHYGFSPDPKTALQFALAPADDNTLLSLFNRKPKWATYDIDDLLPAHKQVDVSKTLPVHKATDFSNPAGVLDTFVKEKVLQNNPTDKTIWEFTGAPFARFGNMLAYELFNDPGKAVSPEWLAQKVWEYPQVQWGVEGGKAVGRTVYNTNPAVISVKMFKSMNDPQYRMNAWREIPSDVIDGIVALGTIVAARDIGKVASEAVPNLINKIPVPVRRTISRAIMAPAMMGGSVPNGAFGYNSRQVDKLIKSLEENPATKQAIDDVVDEIGKYVPLTETEDARRYGFVSQLLEDPKIPDEVKAKIDDLYKVRPTKDAMIKAETFANEEPELALKLALNGKDENAVFVGNALIKKAAAADDWDTVNRITKKLKVVGLESGRTSQAFVSYSLDTPEGVLRYTQSKINDFNTKGTINGAKSQRVERTANQIKKAFEKALGSNGSISKRSRKAAKDAVIKEAEEVTSAQRLADKVVKHLKEPRPDKEDKLIIDELFKIAKDSLPEKEKKVGLSAIDTIREIMAKADENKQTYEEAKKLVIKKFEDKPAVLKAIKDYEASHAAPVVHSSTIKKAIADEVKAGGESIRDVVHQSLRNQETSVYAITKLLTGKGFSKEASDELAIAIEREVRSQHSAKKVQILEQLMKKVPRGEQQTVLEKTEKLSNLGALDSEDYLDLARSKLGLKNLTNKDAKRVHGMAQIIQDMPGSYEKYLKQLELVTAIGELRPMTKGELANDIAAIPKSILASGDVSGLRQAALTVPRHPILTAKALPGAVKSLFSEDTFNRIQYAITQDSLYKVGQSGEKKLAITDMHTLGKREESFRSTLAEKLPVIGRIIKGSNRAYVALLNTIRQDTFNQLYAKADTLGIIRERPEVVEQIADLINHSTGRGSIKSLEASAEALGTTLFAPRLIASRIKVFNHMLSPHVDPFVRKEAAKQFFAFGAAVMTVLELAKLGGAEVETDTRSADFGKIKVGETRIDIMGGYQQYIVLEERLRTGVIVSSTSGQEYQLGVGYKPTTRLDIIGRFAQSKENPALSFVLDALRGSDALGEKFNLSEATISRLVPLLAQDLYDLKNSNPELFLGAGLAGAFGAGLQTYGRSTSDIRQLKSQYLLTIGKGNNPERSQALANAKDALKSGDKKSFDKYLDDYIKAGGTEKGYLESLHAMHPLHDMSQEEIDDFVSTLSPEEQDKLEAEINEYYEKFSPDGE